MSESKQTTFLLYRSISHADHCGSYTYYSLDFVAHKIWLAMRMVVPNIQLCMTLDRH